MFTIHCSCKFCYHADGIIRVEADMVDENVWSNPSAFNFTLQTSLPVCLYSISLLLMLSSQTIRVMVCDNGKGLGGKTEEEIFTAFGGVAVKPTEGVPIGTLTGQSETATVKPVEAEKKVAVRCCGVSAGVFAFTRWQLLCWLVCLLQSSGLGLTFCKEAAQSLGGRVNLLDKVRWMFPAVVCS